MSYLQDYKVPHPLRKWNEEAYTQVVSIGPFHHKNERLKAMEEHKVRYFSSFLQRNEKNLEDLVGVIRDMEKSIRGCYEETINLNSDRFVKMILVDASFVLELFFRSSSGSWTSDDPIFVQPRADAVMHDLLLLENQLPFFVIEKLRQLAFPSLSNNEALLKLSLNYFEHFNRQCIQPHPNVEIEHFTELIRTFQLPPPDKQPKRPRQMIQNLYSAAQLHEAGLKFEVGTSNCYFDIKLEGVLKIPSFELNDRSEVVIQNIMALEQTHFIENAYFTDYFLFIDSLIKTRKDVDLLCEKRILVNYLGDNDVAKSVTNNLNRGIIFISMRDDYVDLCNQLNSFYENSWNKWKALFIRTYFTSSDFSYPFHDINIMTLLTIIQTVCCIIQLAGPSSKPE